MDKPASTAFKDRWKEVDRLRDQGQVESADKIVQEIMTDARTLGHTDHIIKGLNYRGLYLQSQEEQGYQSAVQMYLEEYERQSGVAKPMIASMIGELYASYVQNNYWRMANRSEVAGDEGTDMGLWSPGRYYAEADRWYILSMDQPTILQSESTADWSLILTAMDNTENLRPSLYDVLAHRYILHLKNDGRSTKIITPTDHLSDEKLFASTKEFTSSELGYEYERVLRLFQTFQSLERYHAQSTDSQEALVHAVLERLLYSFEVSTRDDKDALYTSALQTLARNYPEAQESARALSAIAQLRLQKLREAEVATTTTISDSYADLLQFSRSIIATYPKTIGAAESDQILAQIEQVQISASIDDVVLPSQPIPYLVSYRNVDKLYLRVVKISETDLRDQMHKDNDDLLRNLRTQTPIRQWQHDLPSSDDYKYHHVENFTDGLPGGSYAILMSSHESFDSDKAYLAYKYIQVTQLAYWSVHDQASPYLQVVDRQSGASLDGVTVEIYKQDYSRRQHQFQKLYGGRTDASGHYKMKSERRIFVRLQRGDDVYLDLQGQNMQSYDRSPQTRKQAIYLTDRSIYRPGQMLYGKAIIYLGAADKMPQISTPGDVKVELIDPNGEVVSETSVAVSEYGSAAFSLPIPRGRLTGTYQVRVGGVSNQHYIKVEEYKRPGFEVKVDSLDQEYIVGETVEISLSAMAYAGYGLDGAKVNYRVYRQVNFPYLPRRYRYFSYPRMGSEVLISGGSTSTDQDGKASLSFTAIPDETVQSRYQPTFSYRVEIDVTDINGETQSQIRSYALGHSSIVARMDAPRYTTREDWKGLTVNVMNHDGTPIGGDVKVTIERLDGPELYVYDRTWQAPDQFLHTEAKWKAMFPDRPYKEEHTVENWPTTETIMTSSEDDQQSWTIPLGDRTITSGSYKISLQVKGDKGEPFNQETYVHVSDAGSKDVFDSALTQHGQVKPMAVDETASINLHTSLLAPIYFYRGDRFRLVEYERQQIKGNLTTSVTADGYGGFTILAASYQDNRLFTQQMSVAVPYTHMDLSVKLETFRPVLLPGAKESYTVNITDQQGRPMQSELAASMYDASLDALMPHAWNRPSLFPYTYYSGRGLYTPYPNQNMYFRYDKQYRDYEEYPHRSFPQIDWHGWYIGQVYYGALEGRAAGVMSKRSRPQATRAEPVMEEMQLDDQVANEADAVTITEEPSDEPKIRSDFAENVFFYPQLTSDGAGQVSFDFTMREALTRWKLLLFAHDTELRAGTDTRTLVTQKDLTVQLLAPRFLREGDLIKLPAKVVNLSDTDQSIDLRLELEGMSEEPLSFLTDPAQKSTSLAAGRSMVHYWTVQVPDDYTGAIIARVIVKGNQHTDGEEQVIPVLTNRVLVTESIPISLRSERTVELSLEEFARKRQNKKLRHHSASLEMSSSPAWYAVQSLPYLQDYPYDCAEQIFSKYYANALAGHVARSAPAIKRVYDDWARKGELESPLFKNEDLKAALIEETPWLMDAKSQSEGMKRMSVLFDMQRMAAQSRAELERLQAMQLGDGAWPWFSGGRANLRVTMHIVEFYTHLEALGVISDADGERFRANVASAQGYINRAIDKEYKELKKRIKKHGGNLADDHLSLNALHYLYMKARSSDWNETGLSTEAVRYYESQVVKYWKGKPIKNQGYMGFVLQDLGESTELSTLMKSLTERAILSEELGAYWKYNQGYGWYYRPIETHALMIELYDLMDDSEMVDELRLWLLKNKQTSHWETTKSTAWAIYSLLLSGDDWLAPADMVTVSLGSVEIEPSVDPQAGSLYYRETVMESVLSSATQLKAVNSNDHLAWGALHWQYFTDLDQVESAETRALRIDKQVYLRGDAGSPDALKILPAKHQLQPGDELVVRLRLTADRYLEYLHMKDYRGAGLEPINVLSGYRYQDGLSYYESTRDMATHFFIESMVPGDYVFEYSLRVRHPGDFSNGHCIIESMYAPEMRAHSDGQRITVKE